MTPAAVRTAARAAGRHLLAAPRQVNLDLPVIDPALGAACAIYLAYTRTGEIDYIGKVSRNSGAAGARLREHVRTSRRKHRAWRALWIISLTEISETELLRLERGLIHAFRPPGNVQHAQAA